MTTNIHAEVLNHPRFRWVRSNDVMLAQDPHFCEMSLDNKIDGLITAPTIDEVFTIAHKYLFGEGVSE